MFVVDVTCLGCQIWDFVGFLCIQTGAGVYESALISNLAGVLFFLQRDVFTLTATSQQDRIGNYPRAEPVDIQAFLYIF